MKGSCLGSECDECLYHSFTNWLKSNHTAFAHCTLYTSPMAQTHTIWQYMIWHQHRSDSEVSSTHIWIFLKTVFPIFSLLSTQKQCFGPLRTKCNLKYKDAVEVGVILGGFDVTFPGVLGSHVHLSIFNRFCAFMLMMICGLGLRGTKSCLAHCKQYIYKYIYVYIFFFTRLLFSFLMSYIFHLVSPLKALQCEKDQLFASVLHRSSLCWCWVPEVCFQQSETSSLTFWNLTSRILLL